jgi:hypothetical protein
MNLISNVTSSRAAIQHALKTCEGLYIHIITKMKPKAKQW